jgi:Alkylmercury lyase
VLDAVPTRAPAPPDERLPAEQSPDERFAAAVRRAVYDHFVREREAPSAEAVAAGLRTTPDAVRRAFQRLADARVLLLKPGTAEVLSAPPFYGAPAAYRVETPGGAYWASCIWEALAIPPLLGVDGILEAPCPDCGERLRVEMRGGACRGEGEYVFHFLVPAARFWENVFFTCANQLLFHSAEHARAWCAERGYEPGYVGTLQQAWELARAWYGDRLRPDFRRRTPEEAQALFEQLGLRGPFWRLRPGA